MLGCTPNPILTAPKGSYGSFKMCRFSCVWKVKQGRSIPSKPIHEPWRCGRMMESSNPAWVGAMAQP